jgi:hypothetical protein
MIDADIIFIKASLYRVSSLPAGGPNIASNHDDVNFRKQDLIIIDILYSFSFKFSLEPHHQFGQERGAAAVPRPGRSE